MRESQRRSSCPRQIRHESRKIISKPLSKDPWYPTETHFSIDLEPDVTLSTTFYDRTDCHQADDEGLSLLNRDVHLLANIRSAQEVTGRDDAEVTILLNEGLELLKDL